MMHEPPTNCSFCGKPVFPYAFAQRDVKVDGCLLGTYTVMQPACVDCFLEKSLSTPDLMLKRMMAEKQIALTMEIVCELQHQINEDLFCDPHPFMFMLREKVQRYSLEALEIIRMGEIHVTHTEIGTMTFSFVPPKVDDFIASGLLFRQRMKSENKQLNGWTCLTVVFHRTFVHHDGRVHQRVWTLKEEVFTKCFKEEAGVGTIGTSER